MNIHLFGVTSSFSFSRYRRNLSALLKIQPFPTENKYAVVAKKTENMVWVNEESEEEESIEVEPRAGTDSANTQLPGGVVDKKGVVTENTMVKERGVVEEKIKID